VSLNSTLIDGSGNKYKAKVSNDNALYTTSLPYPPFETQLTRPYRRYLTDDGTTTGSNDIGVDGSSTTQSFYVQADENSDIYILSLSIIIGYASSGKPYLFADGTALTNGLKLFYESTFGENIIDDELKSNSEFLRLANNNLVLSDWEVRHVGALNDYGYFCQIDLNIFSPGLGVKLDRGSSQRLVMQVRDDATAATTFNVQAYGFERFE